MNAILMSSEIPKGLDHGLAWIRESRVIYFVFIAYSLEFLFKVQIWLLPSAGNFG